ncbi:sulfurtransferase complex subunit TusB [Candidatus Sororendozoicomonas aggregata]|uniref:sulfurtransferase complex subunit TusB n=1 Tax=Candidatus Sororendozoicomonas aggregata TaxID=3073239 RepID=UPI002ED38350
MRTLHIINKTGNPLVLCQRVLTEKDGILLIEDGVYLLAECAGTLTRLSQQHPIYALEADVNARGMTTNSIELASYPRFVTLVAEYDRAISWH